MVTKEMKFSQVNRHFQKDKRAEAIIVELSLQEVSLTFGLNPARLSTNCFLKDRHVS